MNNNNDIKKNINMNSVNKKKDYEQINKIKKLKVEINAIFICTVFLLILLISGTNILAPNEYDIIFLGDSIFGNVRDDTSIPSLVEQSLGKTCFNGGLGGTTAAKFESKSMTDVVETSASLCSLAKAVKTREFNCILSMQQIRDDGDLDYFDGAVKDLSKVSFRDAEVIFIEHGLNDFFFDIEVGDAENSSEYTYYGALISAIRNLKRACPNTKIILITPVSQDKGVAEYADAMIRAGEAEQIEVIDMYREGIITDDNINESTIDGTHLSEKARKEYAKILASYL